MSKNNLEILNSFDLDSLPDLDVVTLGALELFADTSVPEVDFDAFSRPLVVGSVNGYITGQILFEGTQAVFADENSYISELDANKDIDGAFLLSASGSKHAIVIAKTLHDREITTKLITNNTIAPAKEIVGTEHTYVFPRNREPYTYNTSTYMGMMLAKTAENPESIYSFIQEHVAPVLPSNIADYSAYVFIVPPRFSHIRSMLRTKFDELFGPHVIGRSFTTEEIKHAKTVIGSPKEYFISFGEKNTTYGESLNRLHISLPEDAGYVAMLAISYFVVGHIQEGKPAYFKGSIAEYCRGASEIFGNEINPIVE